MCYINLRIISIASVSLSSETFLHVFLETVIYLHNEISYSTQNMWMCVYVYTYIHTHTHSQNTYTISCVSCATILLMHDSMFQISTVCNSLCHSCLISFIFKYFTCRFVYEQILLLPRNYFLHNLTSWNYELA